MIKPGTIEFENFTADTYFCDYRAKGVQKLLRELDIQKQEPQQKAMSLFLQVRDRILFGFDPWQIKASETLAKGYGMCSNKALLFVALLRGVNIPARLAWVPLKRAFLKPAWGPVWPLTLTKILKHVIAQVNLAGKWISVDLTLDPQSYERLYLPENPGWNIDWNGSDDCLVFKDNVTGGVEAFDDIDGALSINAGNFAPPNFISVPFMKLMNHIMWRKAGIR